MAATRRTGRRDCLIARLRREADGNAQRSRRTDVVGNTIVVDTTEGRRVRRVRGIAPPVAARTRGSCTEAKSLADMSKRSSEDRELNSTSVSKSHF